VPSRSRVSRTASGLRAARRGSAGRAGAVTGGPARGRPGRDGSPERAAPTRAGAHGRLAEVARGTTLNLAGAAVAAVMGIGFTVLTTRHFSKPVAGAFFTAISAFLIIRAVAGLGANTGLVYFVARLRSLGEDRRIPALLRGATIWVLLASAVATVLAFVLALPLARVLLSGHSDHVPPADVATALRALALGVPFAALLPTYLGATRGYRDMLPTVALSQMGLPAAQLMGVVAAIAAGSAALLAPLYALPFVPAAAIAWLWLRRIQRNPPQRRDLIPDLPPELAALMALSTPVLPRSRQPRGTSGARGSRLAERHEAKERARGFWRFSIPRGIANTAQNVLQRIDIVLVAAIRGPSAAAVYTAATRFLVIGQFASSAISNAAQPRFTEFFAVGERNRANVLYQVTTGWTILLTWPLYLLSVVYGPQILAVFGHSYRAGYPVMVILGLAMLLATACGQVDMVLITTGRSSWSLFNGLLTVAVNVGLDLVLIPRYGILGAAIGWAVAIVVSNVIPLVQLAAVLRLHPFGRGTMAAVLVCAVCFLAVPLGMRAVIGARPVATAAAVVVGGALLVLGLWVFRNALSLSAMPGVPALRARWSRLGRGRGDL